MDPKEILKFCIGKGLLIEPEVLNMLSEVSEDTESVKLIIEKIKSHTQRRIITKGLFEQNREQVTEFFLTLPQENQKSLEKLKIKLGLQIEISKEISSFEPNIHDPQVMYSKQENINRTRPREELESNPEEKVRVFTKPVSLRKKIDVEDFVKNLRNRLQETRNILQEHSELDGLVSINKLSGGKKISVIGMVFEKRTTKNRNIILSIEDLTGKTKVLINQNKPDLYKKAEEIALDSIVGFSGFGDREIIFANNIVFPDSVIIERKRAPIEEYALFISDLQYGGKLFLKESFEKFIAYLSDEGPKTDEVKKIKYLFIVGDLVSGVGVYPGQKKDLEIEDIEEQYKQLTEILKRVRQDIKIIVSPGNHDGVRLMEPQPPLDEKYSWSLYSLPNVIMTGNPAYVNIGATKDFPGFDILTYHGFSYPYYANTVPSLLEGGVNAPEKIMAYLLKNRHLAPSYSSVQFFPSEKDELVIRKVPDIFVSGHLHKFAISSYNNVLIISNSAWELETENQKKRGNKPDFCKVPVFNLKTGGIKILDFE